MDESSYPLKREMKDDLEFLQELVGRLERRAYCDEGGRCFGCLWVHAVQDAAEALGLAEEDVWADD